MKPLNERKEDEVYIAGSEMAALIAAVQKKGAAFRVKVSGSSMNPAIRSDDWLTISPLRGALPLPGEIVAFRHSLTGRMLVHRVIKKENGSYFIRGDNQRYVAADIPVEQVIGIITKIERRGRAIFWPDRFAHPLPARLYFRICLVYLGLRRIMKILVKPLRRCFSFPG